MEHTLAQGGLIWRVLVAWADLRGSMRVELDRDPSEGRLLFYVMLFGVVWFSGKLIELSFGPMAPTLSPDEFMARVSAHGASVFFLLLMMYALAAVLHAFARAGGGAGEWRATRAALFWAALVSSPVILCAGLLSMVLAGWPVAVTAAIDKLGELAAVWATACCLSEAHGFRDSWRGLAVIVSMAVLIAATVYLGYLAVAQLLYSQDVAVIHSDVTGTAVGQA